MASLVTTTVAGTLTVNPDADSALEIVNGGANAIVLRAKTGDELYVGSNGASAVRFPSAGGIDVTGTITGSTFGSINLTTSTQHIKWPFTSGQANSRSWGWIAEQGAYGYFQLYRSDASDGTLDTEVMRFRNTGNAELRNDLLVDGKLSAFLNTTSACLHTRGSNIFFDASSSGTNVNIVARAYDETYWGQMEFTASQGILYTRTTGSLILGANNAGAIYIVNGGNVGIGTTNPGTYKLYVNGTSYLNGAATFSGFVQVNNQSEMATSRNAPTDPTSGIILQLKNTNTTDNVYNTLMFKDAQGNDAACLTTRHTDHGNNKASIGLWTRDGGNVTERMTIAPRWSSHV